jgi:SAM-dependent methyltransferase
MTEQNEADQTARVFFEDLWKGGDPWEFETSDYEQRRFELHLEMLGDRRYGRALEIGCGAGAFTRLLSPLVDELVGIDVAESAVERAKTLGPEGVDYRAANAMEFDLGGEGPWDLVVVSDTITYLGWLYSFSEVSGFVVRVFESVAPGGRCLLGNSALLGDAEPADDTGLATPWLARTYRDLFRNVGFELEREELFEGEQGDDLLEVVLSLLAKPQ